MQRNTNQRKIRKSVAWAWKKNEEISYGKAWKKNEEKIHQLCP
jgi:hypothetical protein